MIMKSRCHARYHKLNHELTTPTTIMYLRECAQTGYIETIKLLVKMSINLHFNNEYTVRSNVYYGHLCIVIYVLK